MTEIEDISREIQRLENRVIRAAVNRFYIAPNVPDEPEVLESELEQRVDELVASLKAIPFKKRNGKV